MLPQQADSTKSVTIQEHALRQRQDRRFGERIDFVQHGSLLVQPFDVSIRARRIQCSGQSGPGDL
jgi:hypothetical protein